MERHIRVEGPERFEVWGDARTVRRAIAANFDAQLAASSARYSST